MESLPPVAESASAAQAGVTPGVTENIIIVRGENPKYTSIVTT